MKIAFLLPTVDFGKDGIADYTARLAGEVEQSGHETLLVPLGRNNWLRAGNSLRENIRLVRQQILNFSPDVISWQFDGRIFHPRSIFPRHVIPRFSELAGRIHLMAHETWEGDEEYARLRRRLKGVAQRRSFQGALRVIAPDVVHTSNEVYLEHLRSSGFSPRLLPLFSSVSVTPHVAPRDDYDGDTWEFVLFGGFRDHWNPSEFISSFKSSGRKIVIHHVGRHNSPVVMQSLRENCEGWARFVEHGQQSDQRVSEILLRSHFAISTYDCLLLRKSSVYATFVEHGLPVMVPRNHPTSAQHDLSSDVPQEVLLADSDLAQLSLTQRQAVRDSLGTVTNRFLRDVNAGSSIKFPAS